MPMTSSDRQRLAASWLMMQTTPELGATREDLAWVVEKVWDLCDDAPNDALEFVLAVLDRDASHATLAILAAGPLEALLRRHGPRMIGRVERCARRDANFARLLAHVWQSALPKTIWTRVEHVRERHLARDDAETSYRIRSAAGR
ncbi:MAG TPA: hypothetical protein VGN65_09525 [Casimicrobiaceae bacterium]